MDRWCFRKSEPTCALRRETKVLPSWFPPLLLPSPPSTLSRQPTTPAPLPHIQTHAIILCVFHATIPGCHALCEIPPLANRCHLRCPPVHIETLSHDTLPPSSSCMHCMPCRNCYYCQRDALYTSAIVDASSPLQELYARPPPMCGSLILPPIRPCSTALIPLVHTARLVAFAARARGAP